jgi:hypothetical protein
VSLPVPSDADRDALADLLAAHYAAGRLSLEELRRRVELALSATTAAAAAESLEGLPPLPAPTTARTVRGGRHGESPLPEPGWIATGELFVDPSTGRLMRVWLEPGRGTRRYVPEAPTDR